MSQPYTVHNGQNYQILLKNYSITYFVNEERPLYSFCQGFKVRNDKSIDKIDAIESDFTDVKCNIFFDNIR